MNNIKYDNTTFSKLFLLYGPLPKNLNILDKYEFIQYCGIRIPRIPLDNNNILNFKEIFYYPKEETYLNDSIYECSQYNENKDIYEKADKKEKDNKDNSIKNIANINLINNNKNIEINIKDDEYLLKNKKNYYLNNKNKEEYPLNNFKNEINHINLIPPELIISVISNNDSYISNLETNKLNLYDTINNRILKNINDINKLYYNSYVNNIQKPIINNNINAKTKKSSKILFSTKNKSLINNSDLIIDIKENIIKRGRKEKKLNIKIHRATDKDNILRKIQVHFLTFIIHYINDIIRVFIKEKKIPLFKDIDYDIKKNVKLDFVENLKSKCIGDILKLRVTPKYKIHDDIVNKTIYDKVCALCPFMTQYLQRSYLSLFKEYYYNKNKIFIVNGEIIPLSPGTKTFNDLINRNYCYKEKIKNIAVNYFLNRYRKFKKPNFKVKVISNNKNKNKNIKNDKG